MRNQGGRIDAIAMQQWMRGVEERLRALEGGVNRQSGDARWTRSVLSPPGGLTLRRSDGFLRAHWNPVTLPDLRYYEVQMGRRSDFSDAEIVQTTEPYHAWTFGLGAQGFYFYVRVRSIGADRRIGAFGPRSESPVPDRKNLAPQAGILRLPRTTDVFQVGGQAQTIDRIMGGWIGRCVTLYFVVAHTVEDNDGIRLSGNFSATADSTLTLRYIGDPYGWVAVSSVTSI